MTTGRFAPTPSGGLHLGNALCCLLAWLSARKQNGRFLMRVEDVDVPRCPRKAGEQALNDLRWLGFDWDEEALWQSERTGCYQSALDRLSAMNLTYPCFCTRAELHREAAPNLGERRFIYPGTCGSLKPAEIAVLSLARSPAIRLRVPDEEIAFEDGLQGSFSGNLRRDWGDLILRRSDGLFAYQLAVVVDDGASGVTEVVRGRDLLDSTPVQMCLQQILGLPSPAYIHIPLLLAPDGRRLAKRDHDLDLSALSRRCQPGALLGLLAYSAGLQDSPASTTLNSLLRDFSWDRVPRGDIRLPALP
ncbi:MAG: tRNA glutamyl-Q(34) synthetase GluQRS [Clostridia bacterium]|nr:tRNA glutamyl-Q(34) synthetase GluQRS [Clostridia bacterium]